MFASSLLPSSLSRVKNRVFVLYAKRTYGFYVNYTWTTYTTTRFHYFCLDSFFRKQLSTTGIYDVSAFTILIRSLPFGLYNFFRKSPRCQRRDGDMLLDEASDSGRRNHLHFWNSSNKRALNEITNLYKVVTDCLRGGSIEVMRWDMFLAIQTDSFWCKKHETYKEMKWTHFEDFVGSEVTENIKEIALFLTQTLGVLFSVLFYSVSQNQSRCLL